MPGIEHTASAHYRAWPALLAIGLLVATVALAVAGIAGWLMPGRLTSQCFTHAIETGARRRCDVDDTEGLRRAGLHSAPPRARRQPGDLLDAVWS